MAVSRFRASVTINLSSHLPISEIGFADGLQLACLFVVVPHRVKLSTLHTFIATPYLYSDD